MERHPMEQLLMEVFNLVILTDFTSTSRSSGLLILQLRVRLPCGSASTSKTFNPELANATPRLTAVVVFPTPPFWLAMAITLHLSSNDFFLLYGIHPRRLWFQLTKLLAVCFEHFAFAKCKPQYFSRNPPAVELSSSLLAFGFLYWETVRLSHCWLRDHG